MSTPLNRNRRHSDLRDRFNWLSDPRSRNTGSLLNDMMRLRVEADYRLILPLRFRGNPMDAKQLMDQAVVTAQDLLDALEAFSPGEAQDGCNCPQAYAVI